MKKQTLNRIIETFIDMSLWAMFGLNILILDVNNWHWSWAIICIFMMFWGVYLHKTMRERYLFVDKV